MALSRVKVWIAGEVLSASDLNAEFTSILDNGQDLAWPATKAKDLDGQELILDGDADTSITADSDDVIDIRIAGTDGLFFGHGTGNTAGWVHADPGAHTVTASTDYGIIRVGNTNAVTVPAGTTAIAAGIYVEIPNWTATGTITESAALYIEGAATEATTDFALIVDAGDVRLDGNTTMPNQPAFLVNPASNQSNIAVGSDVTVVWGTEVFDQGADFASNTFTAPVTGKYQLNLLLLLISLDTATTDLTISIVTSNRSYLSVYDLRVLAQDARWVFSATVTADMDSSDTVTVTVNQADGTQQVDVSTGSRFSGCLLV